MTITWNSTASQNTARPGSSNTSTGTGTGFVPAPVLFTVYSQIFADDMYIYVTSPLTEDISKRRSIRYCAVALSIRNG